MTSVNTEDKGRYTEIYIDGVPDGSIAYDEELNELIVDGEYRRRESNEGLHGVIVELPSEE